MTPNGMCVGYGRDADEEAVEREVDRKIPPTMRPRRQLWNHSTASRYWRQSQNSSAQHVGAAPFTELFHNLPDGAQIMEYRPVIVLGTA